MVDLIGQLGARHGVVEKVVEHEERVARGPAVARTAQLRRGAKPEARLPRVLVERQVPRRVRSSRLGEDHEAAPRRDELSQRRPHAVDGRRADVAPQAAASDRVSGLFVGDRALEEEGHHLVGVRVEKRPHGAHRVRQRAAPEATVGVTEVRVAAVRVRVEHERAHAVFERATERVLLVGHEPAVVGVRHRVVGGGVGDLVVASIAERGGAVARRDRGGVARDARRVDGEAVTRSQVGVVVARADRQGRRDEPRGDHGAGRQCAGRRRGERHSATAARKGGCAHLDERFLRRSEQRQRIAAKSKRARPASPLSVERHACDEGE